MRLSLELSIFLFIASIGAAAMLSVFLILVGIL
jgi:hypothetical protein